MYLENNIIAYLIFATDDISYISKSETPLDKILDRFGDFFFFKVKKGTELQFLNFRIIQSKNGMSIDQIDHITKGLLK